MALFKLLIVVILYCSFSFTMSQTSREYRSLKKKLKRMQSAFETELEDLKSEFRKEKIKVEDLRKQLLMSTNRTEDVIREKVTEPEIDRVGLAAPTDEFNKLNNRVTVAMHKLQNTTTMLNNHAAIINSVHNDLQETKNNIASFAYAVVQIQRHISNETVSHGFGEEKIKGNRMEEDLKQSISEIMSEFQTRFKNEMSSTLDNVIVDVNTTVEVSKHELLSNLSDLTAALAETKILVENKLDEFDEVAFAAKSLLCGNGYFRIRWGETKPVCECNQGYSGVHCEINTKKNGDSGEQKPAAHLMGSTFRIEMPPVLGQFPISHWIRNEDLAFTNKVQYRHGRIVIIEAGLYYVYSQLSFLEVFDMSKTIATRSQSLSHHIYRYNIIYPAGGEEEMIQSSIPKCSEQNKALGEYTSYLGAMFHLRQGDEVFVKVSNLTLVVRDPKMNSFGLFKVN